MENFRVIKDGNNNFVIQQRFCFIFWLKMEDDPFWTYTFDNIEDCTRVLEELLIEEANEKKSKVIKEIYG